MSTSTLISISSAISVLGSILTQIISISISISIPTYPFTYIHTAWSFKLHTHKHTHIHIYIYLYLCAYLFMRLIVYLQYLYIYISIYIQTDECANTYMHKIQLCILLPGTGWCGSGNGTWHANGFCSLACEEG
jgi:hypothetical protein